MVFSFFMITEQEINYKRVFFTKNLFIFTEKWCKVIKEFRCSL